MAVPKHRIDDIPDEDFSVLPVRGLTFEEGFAVLDLQARQLLDLSGEEFLERWRSDAFSEEFKEEHHSAFVFLSLMALPFGR